MNTEMIYEQDVSQDKDLEIPPEKYQCVGKNHPESSL